MTPEQPAANFQVDHPILWEPTLAFLKYTIGFLLAGSALFAISVFIVAPDQKVRAINPALLSLVAAYSWYLLSRHRIAAAVNVLAFGLWAGVTGISLITGGVYATIAILYPFIVLMAGWMIGRRTALAVALLTVAATLGLVAADAWGYLPSPLPTPPLLRWMVQSLVVLFAVPLIVSVVRSYNRRLLEVGRLGDDLALRAAELNHAQAVAHVGSWVYDIAADQTRLSAETCRIFGMREGATGSYGAYLARIHPDDRGAVEKSWREALTGKAFDLEHRIVVGDSFRWVRQRAEPEIDAGGKVMRCVGTTQDITERKQADEELRASEQKFVRLLTQVPLPLGVVDKDGNIVHLNQRFTRVFGYARDDIPTLNEWWQLAYPDEAYRRWVQDRWGASVARAALEGTDIESVEYHVTCKNGAQRVVAVGGVHLGDQILATFTDVTEHKQAEAARDQLAAQLRESQKMEALGTLAGGVAHDFNNIVAAIAGNVDLASQDVGPGHAALESLEEIRKSSVRAKALVQQILAFGRRQSMERKVISLVPVVEESVHLLRATLPAGVKLTAQCAADVPQALANTTQVEQVILNLCTNAWQAAQNLSRPAVIELRLEACAQRPGKPAAEPAADRYACLSVRDNGTGMDAETRRRIFEPFFTTKPVNQGTGLGLSVVHGIVRDHDATITVESVPGQGSTFCIYFPAAPVAAKAAAAEASDAVPIGGQGRRILYLDDDEAIVFLMRRMLERRGYRVSGYTDPYAALEAVRAAPDMFDLAVTDYNMPGMSGLEMASALRRIRADLPIALASGYITEQLRANAPGAGVSELIYKPDTVEELFATVARLANAVRG